jgi:hypothetical protein
MHRTVAAALVAALALGVASCGSSESLTRAQLVRRIEIACREGQQLIRRRMRASSRPRAFIAAIIDEQRYVLDRVGGLHPTDAAKAQFDAYKNGLEQRLQVFEEVQSKAHTMSVEKAVDSMRARAEAITTRYANATRKLGVRSCY